MAKKYKKRLNNPNAVRQYIADLIHRVDSGELEPAKASKLGYLANILLKGLDMVYQQDVHEPFEDRLQEIERLIDNG